jgi:uncharacterized protein YkwD
MKRLALCLVGLCVWSWSAQAESGLTSDEARLFGLLNQERARLGLPIFAPDQHLMIAARAHSEQMASYALLSHQLVGEADPGARLGAAGLRASESAENVAFAGTIEQAHDGLMRSPPHLANIKNAHYNRVGLGISRRNGRLWVTEDFAHVLPAYSDEQFRAALVATLNRARQRHGLEGLLVDPAPALHQIACAGRSDLQALRQTLPGATELAAFTEAEPDIVPAHLDRMAGDSGLRRISLGVCLRPGAFAGFSVVAAFYP